MSNNVRAGFRGLAEVDGHNIRCTSFSVNPNQDISFYNHIIGLKDKAEYTSSKTKGEYPCTSKSINTQRTIWRPGVITVAGGMSFPATEDNLKPIFERARYGQCFDVNYHYYCKDSSGGDEGDRKFKEGRINSFDFSVTAGDILNISTDLMFKKIESPEALPHYKTAEKLITWDQVKLDITNAPFKIDKLLIQGFNFKINNNVMPIYVCGDKPATNDYLFPSDLRLGMQEITGSLTFYLDGGQEFISVNQSSYATISVTVPGLSFIIKAVFKTSQMDGAVGPIMTQMPFVGVDKTFE